MSVFVDYVILKQSYDQSHKRLRELLDRKEEAFTRTLPSAIRYDIQKVMHSVPDVSALDEYVMAVERLNQQIREMRIIKDERRYMLMEKAEELKTSLDEFDRIFVMYYLKKLPAEYIASLLDYSVDAIYYKKRQMEKRMDEDGISLEKMFSRR